MVVVPYCVTIQINAFETGAESLCCFSRASAPGRERNLRGGGSLGGKEVTLNGQFTMEGGGGKGGR